MKIKSVFFILTLLVTLFFMILAGYFIWLRGTGSLAAVESYKIYYRGINEKILNDMSNYDLVIVEASHFDSKAVQRIKQNKNTIILGYLSVMEIGSWDREILDRLNETDYLTVDRKKVKSEENGNNIGDISQAHYRQILIKILESRILSKGMDGVLLDTVDVLDDYTGDPAVYKRLMAGYTGFLRGIRSRFSDAYILQNRGFSSFYNIGGDYLDGIVWENFNSPEIDKRDTVRKRIDKLEELNRKKGIIVFTVSYENERANKAFASKMNWKHLQHNAGTSHNTW